MDEAVAFVKDTGVDYLAVSIGNTPGVLGDGAPIDVPLVKELSSALNIPLVLHGGTSVPADTVSAVVQSGIAKINIDAAVKGGFREALIKAYSVEDPIVDTRQPMAEARVLAEQAVARRIHMFGANGRAD